MATRTSRQARHVGVGIVAGLLLVALTVSGVLAGRDGVSEARAATARFNSVVQAERAGYVPFPAEVPLHHCIESLADPSEGAMGIHWVNPGLLDGELDPTAPEVLVYAPKGDGRLELVALEYVVFDDAWEGDVDPTLFGRTLTPVPAPNRYEIPSFWQVHLWLYQDNPSGLFADFNPTVSC